MTPAGAGERRADEERRRDHAVDVDPIIEAASRSNEVARIALPIFVRATSSVSRSSARSPRRSSDLRHRQEDVP
jgi:hypothetical protein